MAASESAAQFVQDLEHKDEILTQLEAQIAAKRVAMAEAAHEDAFHVSVWTRMRASTRVMGHLLQMSIIRRCPHSTMFAQVAEAHKKDIDLLEANRRRIKLLPPSNFKANATPEELQEAKEVSFRASLM